MRRRSRSVSLFAGGAGGADTTGGVGVVAAVRRRTAVERTTPVNALAVLVDTPASASSVHAVVSACSDCRRNPLSRRERVQESVSFSHDVQCGLGGGQSLVCAGELLLEAGD